jgi:hypothetical protein
LNPPISRFEHLLKMLYSLAAALLLLLGVEAFEEQVPGNSTGCPNRAFIGCILQVNNSFKLIKFLSS